MHVRMYACMYVCMIHCCVCMLDTFMYICMYACMYVYMHGSSPPAFYHVGVWIKVEFMSCHFPHSKLIHGCIHAYKQAHIHIYMHACIKLIAFELAGEDRERRETPVLIRLKIAFTRCTCLNGSFVFEWEFPLASRILPASLNAKQLYCLYFGRIILVCTHTSLCMYMHAMYVHACMYIRL